MNPWHLLWIVPLSIVIGALVVVCVSCIAVTKASEVMMEQESEDWWQ